MRKSDVQTHRAGYGYGGTAYPAINVKCYGPSHGQAVANHFKCDEQVAERACQFAFESAQEQFWAQATEYATDVFGTRVKVWSGGRSGGWLLLGGLPELSDWDAVAIGRYARMANWCARE